MDIAVTSGDQPSLTEGIIFSHSVPNNASSEVAFFFFSLFSLPLMPLLLTEELPKLVRDVKDHL